MIAIEYYFSITDKNNFIHSIDNVVYLYYIKNYNMEKVAKELIEIRENHVCYGWEKLNCSACSKYSWYQNVVHIGSIHISFGKMQSFDKINRMWNILPMLRIEVNPNKHYTEPVFKDVLAWIKINCTSGYLKKYDYAIDVPYSIKDVIVYDSRKEAGLYKGTIYRGQRSQHGFMKIYDKAKEQNDIEKPLTRIEHTLEYQSPLSLEKIIIVDTKTKADNRINLDNLNSCIVKLCLILQAQGIDFEPYIASLNYRRRKTIAPFLYGNCTELEYDSNIINSLLDKVNELFNTDIDIEPANDDTESMSDGFIELDEFAELPFD